MSNDTMLTDDYVAQVLAKEASDASIKYSSMGLEAFRSTKPANKAKPNTRFLGRIIKETTNHNAALLAKEAAEAQARLDDLTEAEEKKRRKLNPSAGDIRRRQLGAISSILQGRKRKTPADQEGSSSSKGAPDKESRDRVRTESDSRRTEGRNHSDRDAEHRTRERRSNRTEEDRRHRDRSRSPTSRPRKHRHRSPLGSDDDAGDNDRYERSQQRKRGRGHDTLESDLFEGELPKRRRDGRLTEEGSVSNDAMKKSSILESSRSRRHGRLEKEDDSDPLDDFGPAPAPVSTVRSRGRGAARGPAAMDGRFSDGYDPHSDMQAEPAANEDWDEAVEVFRDRQKFKQQGAERLRSAGFTEEQIKRWEKGGERDIDDVRWTKAGQQREWDRGKDD